VNVVNIVDVCVPNQERQVEAIFMALRFALENTQTPLVQCAHQDYRTEEGTDERRIVLQGVHGRSG
jgi:hypothetical protein